MHRMSDHPSVAGLGTAAVVENQAEFSPDIWPPLRGFYMLGPTTHKHKYLLVPQITDVKICFPGGCEKLITIQRRKNKIGYF